MSDPENLESIIMNLEGLDNKMTIHQRNCLKCPTEPCDVWIKLVTDWNFYHISMVRELQEEVFAPGYEKN